MHVRKTPPTARGKRNPLVRRPWESVLIDVKYANDVHSPCPRPARPASCAWSGSPTASELPTHPRSSTKRELPANNGTGKGTQGADCRSPRTVFNKRSTHVTLNMRCKHKLKAKVVRPRRIGAHENTPSKKKLYKVGKENMPTHCKR